MTSATVPATTQATPPVSRRDHRAATLAARAKEGFGHYLALSLSTAVLALILAIAAAVIGLPALVGGSAMTVLTQSMEPHLPPGTLVVIRPTPVDEIAVGDVVTYQIRSGEAAVVSHRVMSKTYANGELTFLTQGDNNDALDPDPVHEMQIRGTLWYSIPLLGWVNNLLNGANRPIAVGIAVVALFLYAVSMSVGAGRDRLKKKTA